MSEIWNQLKCLITNQDLNTIKHFPQPTTTTTQQIDCLSILNYPFIPTSLLNYWNRKTYLEKKSLLLQISLILSISLYILTPSLPFYKQNPCFPNVQTNIPLVLSIYEMTVSPIPRCRHIHLCLH